MDFIYKTLWPFTANQKTKHYRWHFEDPEKDHKVVEELFCKYENSEVMVVKCKSSLPGYEEYYAILGRYEKDSKRVIKFTGTPDEQVKTAKRIALILDLDGKVDI